MAMRITTGMSFNNGVSNLLNRQNDMSESQARLTSGKRVMRASDDPTAAARAERALSTVVRVESDLRALEASRNAMMLSERALGDAGELMQQARELMVSAGNVAYSAGERRALATQLHSIRTELLSVANRRDEMGGYLFFPQWEGATPPVVDGPPVRYDSQTAAAQGERMTAAMNPLPINVDGMEAWRIDLDTGDSALFEGLDAAIASLQADPPLEAATETARKGIDSVDASIAKLFDLRARVGGLLNRTDTIDAQLADLKLYAQSDRSAAEDVDLVEALSDFQTRQSSYDAALKTYTMVQRMSLFDYLGS